MKKQTCLEALEDLLSRHEAELKIALETVENIRFDINMTKRKIEDEKSIC